MRLELLTSKPMVADLRPPIKEEKTQLNFSELLRDAIYQVDDLQKESETLSQLLVRGQVENLHDVVIAAEKARLSLDLAATVSNKLVQGYQELSRMQL